MIIQCVVCVIVTTLYMIVCVISFIVDCTILSISIRIILIQLITPSLLDMYIPMLSIYCIEILDPT